MLLDHMHPREVLEAAVVRTVARLPSSVARRVVRTPTVVDAQPLDPHLQLLFELQRRAGKGGFETLGGPSDARREYRRVVRLLERPEEPPALTHDRHIETSAGPVAVRVYKPRAKAGQPCLVYLHGGGFVIGDLETHDGFCRRLCRDADTVVVAVNYRLAPEHRFPAAIEDAVAVTRWVRQEGARELRIDPERVAIAGDSAGGNLALNAAQEVPGLCFSMPIYPAADLGEQRDSMRLFGRGFGLEQSTVEWFLRLYAPEVDPHDPRVSPLRSERLDRCPPTHVVVAGFDVLRDEGLALADRLQTLGVKTTRRVMSSLSHGFIHFTRLPGPDAACDEISATLRRVLHA